MTGQCDHILGMFLSPDIQEGGLDRLTRQSECVPADELFNYCPSCGCSLRANGIATSSNSFERDSMMNAATSVSS